MGSLANEEPLEFQSVWDHISSYAYEMDVVKVYTPCEFVVSISPGTITGEQEREGLDDLQKTLERRLNRGKHTSVSQHTACEGEIVAVQEEDFEWRPFLHIQYNETDSGNWSEGIFLDNGHHTQIQGHNCVKLPCEYPLPLRFKKIIVNNLVSTRPCPSHKPCRQEMYSDGCFCKGEQMWVPKAVQTVWNSVEIASRMYVVPEKIMLEKHMAKIFGSVVFVINGEYVNLTEYLLCNRFARVDEERFLQLYPERLAADQSGEIASQSEENEEANQLKRMLPMTDAETESTLSQYYRQGGSSAIDETLRMPKWPTQVTDGPREAVQDEEKEEEIDVVGLETTGEEEAAPGPEGAQGPLQLGADTVRLVNRLLASRRK